jgi:hypothetical protein
MRCEGYAEAGGGRREEWRDLLQREERTGAGGAGSYFLRTVVILIFTISLTTHIPIFNMDGEDNMKCLGLGNSSCPLFSMLSRP